MTKRILIMGAAGKDFHIFNTLYRDNQNVRVVAFTATQIPHIDERRYPPALAGRLYPDGIPIKSERYLTSIIKEEKVDEVIFAYSDVSYNYIEEQSKKVEAAGATFTLPGIPKIEGLMLKSTKPVVGVLAVRTGAGKSPVARLVRNILKNKGYKVVVVRHPMPYGNLAEQVVQRYETVSDLDKYQCTIEEREDYEPHLTSGAILFAGVDYEKVLREAEKEADIILWDGGNNDFPFFKPDVYITVADPLRAGHELTYYPGRLNFELASVIIINKVDSAKPEQIQTVLANAKKYNPKATVIQTKSTIYVDNPEVIQGKRVLVIEDGPTVTHGEMGYGAGFLAARRYGARELIDPRPYASSEIKDIFQKYSHIGPLLPAIGYTDTQMKDLEATINATPCDLVLMGTPTDLGRYLKLNKPYLFVRYETEEVSNPVLESRILSGLGSKPAPSKAKKSVNV